MVVLASVTELKCIKGFLEIFNLFNVKIEDECSNNHYYFWDLPCGTYLIAIYKLVLCPYFVILLVQADSLIHGST